MKPLFSLLLIAALSLGLSSFYSKSSPLSLDEALAQHKIELQIIPNGGHSGNSINIKVKNIGKGGLKLEVPPGTTFVPADTGEQTLVTAKEEMIVLEKEQIKTVHLFAYCTQLSHHCPTTESSFTLSRTKNSSLLGLTAFLDSLKPTDDNLIQESIWCITDGESVSEIYSENHAIEKALHQYVCAATGQKDTWYSTQREIRVDREQRIVCAPKEIKGEIAFESAESVELQGFVKGSTGKIIVTNPNKTNLPAGKIKFEFTLNVHDWKPGNYSVVYTNNGKEVINQPFTL